MNLYQILKIFILLIPVSIKSYGQWPVMENGRYLNPADETLPYDFVDFTGELFNFDKGQLWQFSLEGGLSLFEDNHGFSVKVPVVRSEYIGIENLSGLGDISVQYKLLTYESKLRVRTLASSALYANFSFPTGNQFAGHGAGVPILSPGFILAYRPVQEIAIYPDFRYTHSFGSANIEWGAGVPGGIPSDPDIDSRKIRVVQSEIFFNYEFNETWFGIAPGYFYEFNQREGTLNIRPELGRLFSSSLAIKIGGMFYVLGRRRLLSWTSFNLKYIF